ncbi:bile acid:sodium symporter family protein, partial [Streptosporangium sp. NPDC001682]
MALAGTLLPIALAIIMFGLGLSLTISDFRRVVVYPKATVVALGCQILVLPAICFGLVVVFDLPPALAVGMMLLAASPGGTTANLYSHLFGGDVALNVTLTAINSVLAVVTLPLVTNLSLSYFEVGSGTLGLQFDKCLGPVLHVGESAQPDEPVRSVEVAELA